MFYIYVQQLYTDHQPSAPVLDPHMESDFTVGSISDAWNDKRDDVFNDSWIEKEASKPQKVCPFLHVSQHHFVKIQWCHERKKEKIQKQIIGLELDSLWIYSTSCSPLESLLFIPWWQ